MLNSSFIPLPFESDHPISANFRTRINLSKVVHIKRTLGGKGKIFVSKNEEVKPSDILGKVILTSGFIVINIAKKLEIDPKKGLKFIKKGLDRKISKGETLASKSGLNSKTIKSPTNGFIENYNFETGELRIQTLSQEKTLTSEVWGIVDEIDKVQGEITIKTMVREVFGIFGSGKERSGILNILGSRANFASASQIKPALRQQILILGGTISEDVLKKAVGFGITGIVTGGMNASDYKAIINSVDPRSKVGSDIGMSLFATEGFGNIPISEDIFGILKKYQGKFVVIHGNTARLLLPSNEKDSILSLRKVSIPFTKVATIAPQLGFREIRIGAKVRLIGGRIMGATGIVRRVDKTITKLESGISTYLITVETSSKLIKIPYTNVELI